MCVCVCFSINLLMGCELEFKLFIILVVNYAINNYWRTALRDNNHKVKYDGITCVIIGVNLKKFISIIKNCDGRYESKTFNGTIFQMRSFNHQIN